MQKTGLMDTGRSFEHERLDERTEIEVPALIDSEHGKSLAMIEDISKSGCRLVVNRPLQSGTDLRVTLDGGAQRNCVVRRCQPIAGSNKFELGVELLDPSWPDNVLPDALSR